MRFGSMWAAQKYPQFVDGCTFTNNKVYAPRAWAMDTLFDEGHLDGIPLKVVTAAPTVVFPKVLIEPYEHQNKALQAFLEFYRENEELSRPTDGTIVLSTSSGKTVLGMLMAHATRLRTIVAVHSHEVEKAWIKNAMMVFGIKPEDIGRIRGKSLTIGRHFTIGSIQTLMNLDPKLWSTQFGLFIADELHRHAATKFVNAVRNCSARVRIGITATDSRKDGRMPCIRWHIGENIYKDVTPRNSVPLRFHGVRSAITFAPTSLHPLEGPVWEYPDLVARMGSSLEYHQQTLAVVKHIIKDYRGDILVTVDRIAAADMLTDLLIKEGISAVSLTGRVTGSEREEVYQDICSSQYKVTVGMLSIISDGADNPYWHHVVNTVAFSDSRIAVQLKGRPIRKMRDKFEGHFWDIVGNVQMLKSMGSKRYQAIRKHIHAEEWHDIIYDILTHRPVLKPSTKGARSA